jgi:hypothetical protein
LPVFLLALGCGSNVDSSNAVQQGSATSKQEGPVAVRISEEQYESIRAGFVLIESAIEGLEELRAMLDDLERLIGKNGKQLIVSVREALDSAGSLLGDIDTDLPDRAGYERDFAVWDENRLSAITAANDALQELQEVGEGLTAIGETEPRQQPIVDDVLLALRLAEEDLSASIVKFGGVVEATGG